MSYVRRVLQEGEQLRHTAKIHWVVYLPGLLFALIAVVVLVLSWNDPSRSTFWFYVAVLLGIIAIEALFRKWFIRWITEIAVTDRRVIYKTGFIRRKTNEMNMEKVESVQVDQSVLGRILDYGDVTILGTGEGFETLKTIAAPLELRNHITGL
jgi:uncharacterized membrane protein YdbT with pleckstrin-like domain